jgi:hypothetical protein
MAELKVTPEVALADFERMCKARRIELDETDWNEEEKKLFTNLRKVICKEISLGNVKVDENDDPMFKFGSPPIKLGKPKGSAMLAMDGKVENARVFAALADISGMGVSHFSTFDVQDIHLLKTFYVLFFQR